MPFGEQVPSSIVAAAESLSARAPAGEEPDVAVVWRAYNEATNGPASDHEPTVATFHDLVAVTARDDAGDGPIGRVANRVASSLSADRELLTQRERDRFEQHVLGELGDAIRGCRLEADELVEAMNELLGGVTTSQGIRVKLDWRLREDVSPEGVPRSACSSSPLARCSPTSVPTCVTRCTG